jgi:fluoride exporter
MKAPVLSPRMKLCWGVGFCGSFTTFSTYSVDVVQWIAQGNVVRAAAYVLTNNVGGVVAAALGLVLVKKLLGG